MSDSDSYESGDDSSGSGNGTSNDHTKEYDELEQAWAAPPAGAAVEQPAAAAAPVAAAPAAAVDSTEAELAALREKLARLQQQGS